MKTIDFYKINLIVYLLVILLHLSCNSQDSPNGNEMKYYKEYDVFTLQGISPIKDTSVYPFVGISENNTNIIIKHFIDSLKNYKIVFTRKKNFYLYVPKSAIVKSEREYYSYIFNDTIVKLCYLADNGKKVLVYSIVYSKNRICKVVYSTLTSLPDLNDPIQVLRKISELPIKRSISYDFVFKADSILIERHDNPLFNPRNQTQYWSFPFSSSFNYFMIYEWLNVDSKYNALFEQDNMNK